MKKKIFWSVCAAAMMSVFAVRAQNTECCQKIPTCAEMGYNLSAPDDNIRSIVPARVTVGIKFVERRHLFLCLLVTLFLHPTRHL